MPNIYPAANDPLMRWQRSMNELLSSIENGVDHVAWNHSDGDVTMANAAERLVKKIAELPAIRKAGPGAHLGK